MVTFVMNFVEKMTLSLFYCYDHGAKVSETVQKVAADRKEYQNAPCMLQFAE